MKKLIGGIIVVVVLFVLVLNPTFIANQTIEWVKANPKNEDAPKILFYVGRGCDLTGNGEKAVTLFWFLYQQYPEKGELCAPALYYCGRIKAEGSYVKAYRMQAIQYLQIVLSQYVDQAEWQAKAKDLLNEVNYEHL